MEEKTREVEEKTREVEEKTGEVEEKRRELQVGFSSCSELVPHFYYVSDEG